MITMAVAHALTCARAVQVAENLPASPRVLADLQERLRDPNAGFDDVTELLQRDSGLTARIIRIANGVVYSKGEPVGTLEEALGRVGFEEVFRLTSLASISGLVNFQLRFYGVTAQRLRENSVFTAVMMEEMAQFVSADPRVSYTAGLLRSAGKIALDATAQRDLRFVRPPAMSPLGVLAWEQDVFGPTNCEVGAALLRAWRMPADVYVPIRDHYLRELAVDPMPMAKQLNLAAGAVEEVECGLPGEAAFWTDTRAGLLEEFKLSPEVFGRIAVRATARFEKMRSALA
jgi:HD-like signal output (HDOD) protein